MKSTGKVIGIVSNLVTVETNGPVAENELCHIRLGGTHEYFGKPVEKPFIGDDDRPAEREDIGRANRLLYVTSGLMMIIVALIGLLF